MFDDDLLYLYLRILRFSAPSVVQRVAQALWHSHTCHTWSAESTVIKVCLWESRKRGLLYSAQDGLAEEALPRLGPAYPETLRQAAEQFLSLLLLV